MQSILENIDKRSFWDIDLSKINTETHKRFIIERVFERGKMDDLYKIIAFYGIENVKKELINSSSLRQNTINLACLLFNLSPDEFKNYAAH